MKIRLISILFLLLPILSIAQNEADTANLSSPYHTIHTHLWFLQPIKGQYQVNEAAKTLPLGTENIEQRTIQLKQILDGKGLRVQMSQLPRSADYRDTLAKENIYVLFPKELPEVYLEKIGEEWKYSEETIEAIPKLHKSVYPFGTDALISWIPQSDHYQFLGLKMWQYIGILILLLASWLLHQLMTWFFRLIIRRILNTRLKKIIVDKKLILQMARLASYIFIVWMLMRMLPIIQLKIEIAVNLMIGLKVIRTVFGVLLGFKIVEIINLISRRMTERTENTMDDQILPIVKQTLNIIIGTIGAIVALNLLDVNVTALIAGISIGGLALALAAQDTVKNLIGSVMIFIDRPFQIGDYIAAGGVTGVVEEVGFRSTRIRTPEHSITTIPNGNLINIAINNLGLRVYRRYNATFNLTYNTTPEQIEAFVEGIKKIIEEHPKTRKDGSQVHFNQMAASSLDVMLVVYYEVLSWTEELETTQDLLLSVLKLAKEIGVDFAFPTTSVYIEK